MLFRSVREEPGDPFDNNCDGVIRCYEDADGDGFGFTSTTPLLSVSTLQTQHLGGVLQQAAFTFAQFPFQDPRGTSAANVLPAYPVQAFAGLGEYLNDVVEQVARADAESNVWYDCRAVEGAAAAGGEGSLFLDCHDEDPIAYPGFLVVSGQVSLIRPEARRAVSGPFDPSCAGPIMCVAGSGAGVQIYDRLIDDRTTVQDECVVVQAGQWRCFAPQGVSYVAGRPSDRGEIAGDDLDNDCDGSVLCYQDVDRDRIGTMPVLDDGTPSTDPFWRGAHFSCTHGPEAEFTGDCHDQRADIKPPVNLTTAIKGDDVSKAPYWSSASAPSATGWDDPTCSGVVLCHSGADNRVYDRYTITDCATQVAAGTYRCYSEGVGDGFDQDCDGAVACWYDGDGDTWGIGQVKLADPATLTPVTSGTITADPGVWDCARPGWLTAARGGFGDDQDCNDANPFERPDGIEPTSSLFVGVAAPDRQRAFDAIGNDIDENCDGIVQCWRDVDGDGFGGGILDATPPPGTPGDLADMSPSDLETFWDGDGHLQWFIVASSGLTCAEPGKARMIGDCHDDNAAAYPGAPPIAGNNYDNNCDGIWTCYQDLDGDGFGSPTIINDGSAPGQTPDRTCTTIAGEADDRDDCLDDNLLTATAAYPQGQRYPIGAGGTLDVSLPFPDQPTIAFLSKPGGIEIYGDGYDENCDATELCFIDNDQDGYVDGTPQLGRARDPLGRIGNVVPKAGTFPGVIPCTGSVDLGDGPRLVAPWPLEGAIVVSTDPAVDPFVNPRDGKALFDCNDADATVNPDASEIFYDGIDQNCDALSDFDRDGDGYDSRTATAERAPCTVIPGSRYTINPVTGCGLGTDCDDSAIGASRHPAPYDRAIEATAMAQVEYGLNDPPTPGPVTRYPEYDPGNPSQALHLGLKGVPETCEAGAQVDNDCDGNVNTFWDCWYDIWEYEEQKQQFWAAAAFVQRARGRMSREYFTGCVQPYGGGTYFVDRSDPLDFTPTQLQDPAILEQAEDAYTDFIWDPTWTPPAFSSSSRYYRDNDGDTEGDGTRQGVRLCDLSAETTVRWLTSRTDCNDDNEAINRQGKEICDRIDNNCNKLVDEATLELTPALSPSCRWHYLDADGDSWGMREDDVRDGSTDRYCLCPLFQAVELDPDGIIRDVEKPRVCEHWFEEGEAASRQFGHRIGGSCYVRNDADCDDLNFNIKPFEPGETPYELIDGVDNDCDDRLPLIELDCDDDNAYPYLPKMTQALLDRPSEEPVESAEAVGLKECQGAPPDVTCWNEKLPVSCDSQTGFWVVPVAALSELGKFTGASRVARASDCASWDCDDTCPSRCAGLDEGCDGLDNDCNLYAEHALGLVDEGLVAEDLDGVPDPIQKEIPALGKVQPSELDLDGDLHVSCNAGTQGRDNQTAITDKGCREYEQFLDCNDLCVLAAPAGPPEEYCNGFSEPDLCVAPGEADVDGDLYRSCGAFGPDPTAVEKIYTLMYSKGDIAAYLEDPDIRPLTEVVPLVPPRRYAGEAFEGTDRENDIRECDEELAARLEAVVGEPLSASEAGVREDLLSVCVRVETCRVLRERIAASSGLGQSNDDLDDVIDRPLSAAPTTGIDVLPAYCEGLEDARCSVVELTLRNDRDGDIYEKADAWRTTLRKGIEGGFGSPDDEERLKRGCVFDANFDGRDEETKKLFHPEQAIARTVWTREQIVAARKLVVEYECFRMYGTFGCDASRMTHAITGDPEWRSPFDGMRTRSEGFFRLPDVPEGVLDRFEEWWIYFQRFSPRTVDGGGTLVGCWGDPRLTSDFVNGAETIETVGGDCKSEAASKKDRFDPTKAHRGMSEGPSDLMATYAGTPVDCSTCLDAVDNNCDGLIDQEDPACARCFVGQGYGCGCSAGPNVGTLRATSTAAMALAGLLAALARRRKRT